MPGRDLLCKKFGELAKLDQGLGRIVKEIAFRHHAKASETLVLHGEKIEVTGDPHRIRGTTTQGVKSTPLLPHYSPIAHPLLHGRAHDLHRGRVHERRFVAGPGDPGGARAIDNPAGSGATEVTVSLFHLVNQNILRGVTAKRARQMLSPPTRRHYS
jgi:hypothetical protein